MHTDREAGLWRINAIAFLVGGGVPLLLNLANFTRAWQVDAEALKLGIWCSFTLLVGLTGLAASDIFHALDGLPARWSTRLWSVLAFIGLPGGILPGIWMWQRTMSVPVTLNQKAVLFAGGFTAIAGLLAFLTERILLRIAGREVAAHAVQARI